MMVSSLAPAREIPHLFGGPAELKLQKGLRGLGIDCSSPPLLSTFQSGLAPCQLGQGSSTEACLAAQDQAEQDFFAAQAQFSQQCGGAAGVVSGNIAENQIIGQGPTAETGYQAAQQIYGGVVPAGTFQTSTPTGTIPTTVQPAPTPAPSTPPPSSTIPASVTATVTVPAANPPQQTQQTQQQTTPPPSTSWFTQTSVGSIPNWALVAAGVGVVLYLGGKK